ncbi:2OG-Fe(II) oxygenase family protein [Kitasatospora sp. McL0602]|uniref:2OG-Fe(II) oxygenase family protein n=1 Tax=Kitasatospora sp. McL0602 TaxID=3439530 RepID=UPI003F8BD47F
MTASMALQRAQLAGAELSFETAGGLAQALADGCLLLAIPEDLDLTPGIRLCREFHRPAAPAGTEHAAYRGFRGREGVYFDRENFQTEHLLLDGPGRLRHLPPEVSRLCERMDGLGQLVLRAALAGLGVSRVLWPQLTGGAVDGGGTHWFAASHYRTERPLLGCAPHQDTGFVTVLYIEQDGLEARVGDAWVPIDPVPGYFVVNFGGAFEILGQSLTPRVRAILHRVRQCEPTVGQEDRFSFAAFLNPPAHGRLHRVGPDGAVEELQTVEEFLREFNRATWDDAYGDFGIVGTTAAG